jgi:hypothetical protein
VYPVVSLYVWEISTRVGQLVEIFSGFFSVAQSSANLLQQSTVSLTLLQEYDIWHNIFSVQLLALQHSLVVQTCGFARFGVRFIEAETYIAAPLTDRS